VIGSMPTVPISIALVAGGLAVVNPCGFPLLPAFLSFYLGADERRLPPAPTRVVQGLVVGALVTVGFLGFFALVGLPVSYGVGAIARAVPWAGLVTGAALVLAGFLTLLGTHLRLPTQLRVQPRRERRVGAMLLGSATALPRSAARCRSSSRSSAPRSAAAARSRPSSPTGPAWPSC
jgi:cytochrome c-type biogenesis protein